MESKNKTKIWLAQIRANFLILAVLLTLIGIVYAVKFNHGIAQLNLVHAFLLLIGVIATHISVNLFNEYSDFHTKIDFNTNRNPFSGGSGMLTEGHTKPKSVLSAAISTLIIGLAIGGYFLFVAHWSLIVFIALGAFAIVFYTNFLAKILLGEFFAGLTLGTFVVLGTYIALTATPEMPIGNLLPSEVLWMSIPPGILTALLLFLNEFPDAEADKNGGRYHLVIKLGWRKSAFVYILGLALTFGIILLLPLLHIASYWSYLALLPIPLAIKASITALNYNEKIDVIVPAMGQNVMIVLGTDLLIALAVIITII
jgi:1,4-dihydroxy-2-naphthoate octaprenyltransferase